MLTIKYGPIRSVLTCGDPQETEPVFDMLYDVFTHWVDGHFFSEKFQDGVWDGKVHFFSDKTGAFDSGLLGKVLSVLRQADLSVQVEGYPEPQVDCASIKPVTLYDAELGEITLRDHQMHAVRQSLKYSRGIIQVATNGGKTEICAGILKLLNFPNALYLLPRKDILKQTVARLQERLNVQVGVMGDNTYKPQYNGINVAMYHTYMKRFSLTSKTRDSKLRTWAKTVQIVFADECQHLRDERYQKAVKSTKAGIRLGLSGTPFPKKDEVQKLASIGICGPVIAEVSNEYLVEQGISVRGNVLFLEPNVTVRKQAGFSDFEFYSHDAALRDCEVRNHLIAELARGFVDSNRQTVIMVKKVEHGKAVLDFLPEAEFAHGNSSNRNSVKKRLASGEVFICICTQIFDTGLSVDYIEGLILAGGGLSEIQFLQAIGRGLRKAKDKEKDLWIVDFWDTFNKYTKKHSRARYKEILEQGKAFNIVDKLSDALPELQRAMPYVKNLGGKR